jgi:hypothetical protein
MNRNKRIGRLGALIVVVGAVVLAPFLWLGAVAAWLLWRAWWRQAGVRLSPRDGPWWLLAAAAATLPADRRDWGAAMAAELAQVPVQERAARWRFAAGCARAAVFPPGGSRVAVGVAGVAVAATAAAALATGAVLPAGWVFAPTFVGLVGGLATLAVARSHRAGWAWPGAAITGLGLAGVAACIAVTGHYLAEFPAYHRADPPATLVSLPPVTAAVLAVLLAGCLWLALRPPRWLLPGSAAAAAVGRSFRSGLWACAWAIVLGAPLLITAWLAEALVWYQQGQGTVLDGAGGLGVGVNLGDAVWWPLVFLALWAVPLGVVGAAAGSARARRSRLDDLNGAPAARCPDASTPPSLRNGRCQR